MLNDGWKPLWQGSPHLLGLSKCIVYILHNRVDPRHWKTPCFLSLSLSEREGEREKVIFALSQLENCTHFGAGEGNMASKCLRLQT